MTVPEHLTESSVINGHIFALDLKEIAYNSKLTGVGDSVGSSVTNVGDCI